MNCWFPQRESGANHIVKIQQKREVFLTVNCDSRLIFCGCLNSINFHSSRAEIVVTLVGLGVHQKRIVYIAMVKLR